MAVLSTLVRATGTWSLTDVPDDTETCTIGGKVYTFQATLTDVDGNVKIGADIEATLANFVNAINLTGVGAGTTYAASMTVNPHVRAVSSDDADLVVEAKVPGELGNLIDTTDTHGEGAWGATTLENGDGSISTAISEIRDQCQCNSDVLQALDVIDGSSQSEV